MAECPFSQSIPETREVAWFQASCAPCTRALAESQNAHVIRRFNGLINQLAGLACEIAKGKLVPTTKREGLK